MPSETFYCPHCKRQLTKSAQSYVLGEVLRDKSGFIGLGDLPRSVSCPGCGRSIDSMKMLKGEYDVHPDYKNLLPYGGWGILLFFAVFKFVFQWGWIVAVLAGLATGFFSERLLYRLLHSGRKKAGAKKR